MPLIKPLKHAIGEDKGGGTTIQQPICGAVYVRRPQAGGGQAGCARPVASRAVRIEVKAAGRRPCRGRRSCHRHVVINNIIIVIISVTVVIVVIIITIVIIIVVLT